MNEHLETLGEWVRSDEFTQLVAAYKTHWQNGTTGTADWSEGRPEVINEHGVLKPERFEEYMLELHSRVTDALRNSVEMRSQPEDRTLRYLQSTLQQMIGSTNLPDDATRNLFEEGKRMGDLLRSYRFSIGERDGGEKGGRGAGLKR